MFMFNLDNAGTVIVYTAVCKGAVAFCHIHDPDAVGETADT